MREDIQERASALVSGMERVIAGTAPLGEVVDGYEAMGGGDAMDRRTTYVDMMADLGHWLGEGEDGFRQAAAMASTGATEAAAGHDDVGRVAAIIARLKPELAAIGADPEQAVWMAGVHVGSEAYVDGGLDGMEDEAPRP